MQHRIWTHGILAYSLVLVLASVSTLHAQTQLAASQEIDAQKVERARMLKEMHVMTDEIIVRRKGTNEVVERTPAPVFRYNSPSRLYQDGSIWAWGKQGRPLVVMEMFTVNAKKKLWVEGFVLTSTSLVEATQRGDKFWYPRELGIQIRPFPDAPPPSQNKNVRLRQMKQLSRRFTAHQFWDPNNSRFDLRLLVQPVHRYSDPAKGLVDGSMYLMAHEIEPEVIIMIEAVKKNGVLSWQYAVTPIGSAEFHILLDDNEVYQRGRTPMKRGYPIDPYHSIHVNAIRE